ncbi:MAG: hypothetical protein ACJ762_02790 [Solirubrobacteraceae bacterium]
MRRAALLFALAAGLAVPAAHATEMSVSGTVAPVLGIAPGTTSTSGTMDVDVTTEQRGGVTIVTVFPR